MKKLLLILQASWVIYVPAIGQKTAPLPSIANTTQLNQANVITLPTKEGKVFYEFIDSSFNKSKPDVYESAKIWFVDIFKDSKAVIQMEDKEAGEILGKGTFKMDVVYNGISLPSWCQFTARISCRNNKYRLQIYDIMTRTDGNSEYHKIDGFNGQKDELAQNILRPIDMQISDLIKSSQAAISKKADNF